VAKKVLAVVKLQIPAGKATPAPPVGPALGQHGVNIMEFCKKYNEQTAGQAGSIVPVEITIYADRSFSFVTKTPPASVLAEQVKQIAERKMRDLNARSIEGAMRIIEGTARSMGIEVVD